MNKSFIKAIVNYGKKFDKNIVELNKSFKGVDKDGKLCSELCQYKINEIYSKFFFSIKRK